MPLPIVTLKPGREKPLLRKHPWIFAGAIDKVDSKVDIGETVLVQSSKQLHLGMGAFSPHSQIRVRIWSFDDDAVIDDNFIRGKVLAAAGSRVGMYPEGDAGGCRLINAEADGLPGLIVDRYADTLVCQFSAAGVEKWKSTIVEALKELPGITTIYERSDADVRKKERLEMRTGLLHGDTAPEYVRIQEGPLQIDVDIVNGHKTGWYLDQRLNRETVAPLAKDRSVLNCFGYTGGFGLWAAQAGAAEVLHIDSSQPSLDRTKAHYELNGLDQEKAKYINGDAFEVLRKLKREDASFGLIVLDPPKFVTASAQLTRGCRGYKDINMLAAQLLEPGGHLATFSCSGHVDLPLFRKVVADAFLDARRSGQIINTLHQAPDHPAALPFPEGHYLKGLIIRT